jgi:hypothetical protein|tara:strand:+ start:340 stop:498 length:159 start_codon:yes stop_codon:yes gene_type:complete
VFIIEIDESQSLTTKAQYAQLMTCVRMWVGLYQKDYVKMELLPAHGTALGFH